MKQVFLSFMMISLLLVSSCNGPKRTELALELEKANKQCPMSMGTLGSIDSLTLDEEENAVKIVMSVNDEYVSLDSYAANPDLSAKNVLLGFSRGDARKVVKQVADAGVGMWVVFKSMQTGQTVDVKLSPEQIKSITENKDKDKNVSRDLVATQVEMENTRCPYQVDEETLCRKVELKGDRVVYYMEVNEADIDMDVLAEAYDELRKSIGQELRSFNRSVLKAYREAGIGVKYHFYGDKTGKVLEVDFPADEL